MKTLLDLQNALNRRKEAGKYCNVHEVIAYNYGNTEHYDFYVPSDDDLLNQEWLEFYKKPDPEKQLINWDHMRLYWYWLYERMNIWYKRVIKKELFPWTEDEIFQNFKFTNVYRDLDKATIYYVNHILRPIMNNEDVPLETRKKNLIMNTLVYRLFILPETIENIGLLDVTNWDYTWGLAKKNLIKQRLEGKQVFHGAYMVNTLAGATPNHDVKDKLLRAINMIESYWYPNVEQLYENTKVMGMKDLLEYMVDTFICIGRFTAYENLCDYALARRYTAHPLVEWTDDGYSNTGPGAKNGLLTIFLQSDLELEEQMYYLRATWKHYMKEFGYYDRFVAQIPEVFNKSINMRVIEHDLCEFSKYLRGHYKIGHVKNTFKNLSKNNLSALELPN